MSLRSEIDKRNQYAKSNYGKPDTEELNIEAYIETTIDMATTEKYYEGLFNAYINLALHYIIVDPSKDPMACVEKARNLYNLHKLGKRFELDLIRGTLLYKLEVVGDLNESLALARQALKISEELKDKNLIMRNRSNLAVIYVYLGHPEEAREMLELAIDYYASINDKLHLMYDSNNLAEVYFNLNEIEKAQEVYEKGYALATELNEISLIQDITIGLSKIYRLNKDYLKSEALLNKAKTKVEELNNSRFTMLLVIEEARLHLDRHDPIKAYNVLDLDDDFVTTLKHIPDLLDYYKLRSLCAEEIGDYKRALQLLKIYNEYAEKSNTIENEKAVTDAISNAYQKTINRLETIAIVGRELTILSDIDEVLNEVKLLLTDLVPTDIIGIGEYKDDKIYYSHYNLDERNKVPKVLDINDSKSMAAWAIVNNSEICINDLETEANLYVPSITRFYKEGTDPSKVVQSLLYAPLAVKNQIIGVFTLQSYKKNAYHMEEIEIFRILCAYVGIAYNNILQSQELEELSVRDSLTKVYNRRGFIERFDQTVVDGLGTHQHLALLMLDLDHFKNINDSYGHDAGDKVLIALSKLLRNKENDKIMCARLGGEEFALLIKDYTEKEIMDFTNKLLKEIAKLTITYSDHTLTITTSIGVSCAYLDNTITYKEMYKKADKALYQAKENGRNQIQYAT